MASITEFIDYWYTIRIFNDVSRKVQFSLPFHFILARTTTFYECHNVTYRPSRSDLRSLRDFFPISATSHVVKKL